MYKIPDAEKRRSRTAGKSHVIYTTEKASSPHFSFRLAK
jgi:hypothetical protein